MLSQPLYISYHILLAMCIVYHMNYSRKTVSLPTSNCIDHALSLSSHCSLILFPSPSLYVAEILLRMKHMYAKSRKNNQLTRLNSTFFSLSTLPLPPSHYLCVSLIPSVHVSRYVTQKK